MDRKLRVMAAASDTERQRKDVVYDAFTATYLPHFCALRRVERCEEESRLWVHLF